MVRIYTVILCLCAATSAKGVEVHAPIANLQGPLVATVPIDPPVERVESLQAERAVIEAHDGAPTGGAAPELERPVPETESLPLGQAAPLEAAAVSESAPSNGGILQSPAVRTGGALTLVLSLIFALRGAVQAAARRAGGGLTSALGPGGRAPSGVLSVLGRYPVGKGATLVLLQLDRRVLLLSQTSSGFSTLCELTDADEVASIVRKTADDEGASLSKRFSSMLRRFESDPGHQ